MKKDKRFVRVYSQSMGTMEIWMDKETGVHYLYRSGGYGGGLAVLLDENGKPVVAPKETEQAGEM
ncbi:MAG: xylan 1,4-beta-xylosidase [Oscillospiraceae bacterium]|nr:xylan 1,4-beta-xylosidase [Oscillospiraceae bacterium]